MEQKMKSPKMLRQRKILLVMPLLVLPFITIMFWALGGGKMEAANALVVEKKGFNIKLPDANLKEGIELDKMNYYEQAALDSTKLEELIRKDPNYLSPSLQGDSTEATIGTSYNRNSSRKGSTGLNTTMYRDPNEEKVHEKLEALQRAINKPIASPAQSPDFNNYAKGGTGTMHSDDVEKLEEMMQSMNGQNDAQDPELKQLSGMLESILDIQHPDRVQEKLKKVSEAQRGQVFAIATKIKEDNISSLQNMPTNSTDGQSKGNTFYSLEDVISTDVQNAVAAVIHETQTIVNGSTVKLRLVNAVFINGVKIPENNFLFGTASLKGERLIIKINSLRYGNSLFPVDLSVYDMDGLSGIYIPGAINRDVAKASADRSMQTLGVANLDDSWGAQAAGVGIEAAKSLLSKKVKLIKVAVKAGYQVLLRDEKQKQKDSN
jgi:conjugative transposon TraM protein